MRDLDLLSLKVMWRPVSKRSGSCQTKKTLFIFATAEALFESPMTALKETEAGLSKKRFRSKECSKRFAIKASIVKPTNHFQTETLGAF